MWVLLWVFVGGGCIMTATIGCAIGKYITRKNEEEMPKGCKS